MTDPLSRLRRFLRELKRRNVYRVAVAYIAVAFVVLQGARLLVPALVLPEWFYRVIVALALLGFPLSLVLAWAFEMTPEGVRRTPEEAEPAEEGATETGERRSTGYKVLVGLGLVAAAVAGGWYLTGGGGGEEKHRTDRFIAVLPFESMGGEESAQLSLGVHDGLLTRLSNISDLQVISRTSVLQYEDTEKTIPEIARELDARWIVEGTVQQAGGQVQVNAQLIKAYEDTHQWARSYNRELTTENLFAIQSELTKKIARSLEAELSPEEEERVERRPTDNLDAYRLYVQGRRLLDRRTGASIREAMALFGRALREDSTYALAWAGLADARGLYPFYGPDSVGRSVSAQERAARRAVELAPDLAEARASLGYALQRQFEGPAALRELERAVELKPSYAQAHHWLGTLQYFLGRPEAAREHLSLAVELNPRHWNARVWLILAQIASGEYGEALEEARRGREMFPERDLDFLRLEAAALVHLERWEELRRRARAAGHRGGWEDGPLPLDLRLPLLVADVATGDTTTARRRLESLKGDYPAVTMALLQALLGDHETAFESFRGALSSNDREEVSLLEERRLIFLSGIVRYDYPDALSSFRADPRYRRLIRRLNRAWGLNPDGSLPDSVDVSLDA